MRRQQEGNKMDTGSHLLFGATLCGLAMLDPTIAQHSNLAHAVMAAAVVGSHAPDLDALARLKGYNAYIRIHRGFTHSLPALLLWPCLLSVSIAAACDLWTYTGVLFLWSLAAVSFHIFLDWLNAYGVQCFRPLSQRWHHLDILSLFEPFLFMIHGAGLLMWLFTQVMPGLLFLVIYMLTFVYIALRTLQHIKAADYVRKQLKIDGVFHLLPSMHWFHWQFVLEAEHFFYTGTLHYNVVCIKDVYPKDKFNHVVEATLTTDGVRAFLHFAQRIHVSLTELQDGYSVEWRDVRFWHNHKLPFGVDVKLDKNLNVVSQFTGWRKKAWDPPFV
jgi:inner membrane protein